MTTLSGTEILQVTGVTSTGLPSGGGLQCTTQDIANLGAAGIPGGSNAQVQYNNNGAFGGLSTAIVNADGTLNIQPAVVAVSGTTKTLALTDANSIQDCSNGSGQTITLPGHPTVPFTTNTVIQFEQNGAGSVTVQAASGVTLNGNLAGSVSIASQYSSFYIRQESQNVWYAEGLSSGGGITALTGDVTASGSGSVAATVAKIQSTTVSGTTGTGNVVFSASPTLTGIAVIAAQTNSGIMYLNGGSAESAVFSNGSSGTSKALNLDNGNLQSITISGAVAITQTAPTHPGKYTVVVTQDGSGHVYSFSGIKWAGGSAPTYSTTAAAIDVFSFIYDGTSYYGMGGINFS